MTRQALHACSRFIDPAFTRAFSHRHDHFAPVIRCERGDADPVCIQQSAQQ